MTDHKKRPENTNESLGPLRRVILDEPLNVWVSSCEPEDLGEALSACRRLPRHGDVTLVLCLSRGIPAADATRALARAGAIADSSVRVLIEPDPKRAVVGSMQWLRPDDTFCVVWSNEPSRLALEALIALGSSWRGAWDEPENGEFHACPRGPDGFYPHDYQPSEERTKQGEDR